MLSRLLHTAGVAAKASKCIGKKKWFNSKEWIGFHSKFWFRKLNNNLCLGSPSGSVKTTYFGFENFMEKKTEKRSRQIYEAIDLSNGKKNNLCMSIDSTFYFKFLCFSHVLKLNALPFFSWIKSWRRLSLVSFLVCRL